MSAGLFVTRLRLGTEFIRARAGRMVVYLHRNFAPLAPALLSDVDRVMRSRGNGRGNRASGFRVTIEGAPPLFVRHARRGGMMRFMGDLYIGFFPRVVRELWVTAEARRRGVSVPEPVGAMVARVGPGVHRGALITRAITGMTVWEFVRHEDDSRVRAHVLALAREAIDAMHRQGVVHDDLNLHNLFVSTAEERISVVILDFDKARLTRAPVSAANRRANLARLRRSVRKLDPENRYFDADGLKALFSSTDV